MEFDVLASLTKLYENDTGNCFDQEPMGKLFDPPLLAVASANDPWFSRFKEIIGPFHWTPQEAIALHRSGAQARSVICFCLPVGAVARQANRTQERIPSRPWAYVRTFGEQMVTRLRLGLAAALERAGHAACAPQEMPQNHREHRPNIGWSCNWSERHVAFVAGLGTFGLSGGLITLRGVAHRLGSVVTSLAVEPNDRPYGDDPFAWCLRTARGTCGACIKRCPAGAIGQTMQERSKDACFDHTYRNIRGQKGRELFGWDGAYGCGLCQTAVPCEDRKPK